MTLRDAPAGIRDVLAAIDDALAPEGDGLIAFDPELRYLHWNHAMERVTGITAAETLGKRVFDVFPSILESGEDRNFRGALAGETSVTRDRAFFIPDTGRAGHYEAFYSPLRLGGQVRGGLAIVRDITERKRAEQMIRETEGRFRNMADASPVLLWMSGTDSLCNFFNQTWIQFTGRTLEQEWGVGWAEGIHPEDFQRCMDTYQSAFAARRAFEMEYRLRRHDGEYRWILDRGVPRYAPDGTFAGYIGSCVDFTERRELEAELREAVRLRDSFITVAAHELRTPLTPIRLGVDMLLKAARRSTNGLHGAQARLEALDQHVTRQSQIVEQLLAVSRILHGPVVLEEDADDLVEVVREAAQEMHHVGRQAGSVLRLTAPDTLPGHFDRSCVMQVIRNLLSNAFKFGRGRPVDLEVRAEGDAARIVVRDRGIGIAPEDQDRIFERFDRAVPVQRFGGFGLGLWLSRQFVEAMGGTIEVESRPGQGATFIVELPAPRVPHEPAVELHPASPPS